MERISNLIIQKLETMTETATPDSIFSKRKAINALLPRAIFLEQGGQQRMIDVIFRAAKASESGKFLWHRVLLYVSRLFEDQSPTSLNRVIALISPYVPWGGLLNSTTVVARWAAAVLTVPYTEEIGQNVIDALFYIACIDLLRPQIPIGVWQLMKRRPSLLPKHDGEMDSWRVAATIHVRRLGDIEILKSYLLIVWSDRVFPSSEILYEMERAIREDFGGPGVEMKSHRKDLVKRLHSVLGTSSGRSLDPEARKTYTKLRDTLLGVDEQ